MTDENNKVVRLVPKAAIAPPREAIEMLQSVIARIEAGEIATVAVVAMGSNDEMHTAWHGWAGYLIAPTQVLAHRLMRDIHS